MVPGVDSLNVGVSVGIVLHQALGAAVQRRREVAKRKVNGDPALSGLNGGLSC